MDEERKDELESLQAQLSLIEAIRKNLADLRYMYYDRLIKIKEEGA